MLITCLGKDLFLIVSRVKQGIVRHQYLPPTTSHGMIGWVYLLHSLALSLHSVYV